MVFEFVILVVGGMGNNGARVQQPCSFLGVWGRVARWHPRIPNRPQFGIQAAYLVSTFLIWYPAKIWYPLTADLVSHYKFGILG